MKIEGSKWFACPNDVFGKKLSPFEGLILIYLYRRAGPDGTSWPSYATIAVDCGMSKRKAQMVMASLEKRRLIQSKKRKAKGWTSNVYLLKGAPRASPIAPPAIAYSTTDTSPIAQRATEVLLSEVPHNEVPTTAATEKVSFVGNTFVYSEDQLVRWKEAYPAIDVVQSLRHAASWVVANPKNHKKNWHRFVVNWLARDQEKAPRVVSESRHVDGGAYPKAPDVLADREAMNLTDEQRRANIQRVKELVQQIGKSL